MGNLIPLHILRRLLCWQVYLAPHKLNVPSQGLQLIMLDFRFSGLNISPLSFGIQILWIFTERNTWKDFLWFSLCVEALHVKSTAVLYNIYTLWICILNLNVLSENKCIQREATHIKTQLMKLVWAVTKCGSGHMSGTCIIYGTVYIVKQF